MSRKSLNSLRKLRVLDSGLALADRKKSLRDMPRPSYRFLRRLIENVDTPAELRRMASRILVDLLSTPKAKPIESSSSPTLENVETAIAESNPKVIDPEVWDLVGGVPGCVRGETSLKNSEPAQLTRPRTAILPPPGHHD